MTQLIRPLTKNAFWVLMISAFPLFSQNTIEVFDLGSYDLNKKGLVDLEVEAIYYWNERVTDLDSGKPPTGTVTFPGFWGQQGDAFLGNNSNGLCSFYFRLLLPDSIEQYSLKLKSVVSAYEIWGNGQLLGNVGVPGVTAEETISEFQPMIIDLPKAKQVDLVFVIANHYLWRGGGSWEPISIGLEDDVRSVRVREYSIELIACAVILFISVYHFILFIFYPLEKSYLYFGFFTLAGICFLGVRGEMVIDTLFPDFPFALNQRLRYISFYLDIGLVGVYIGHLFRKANRKLLSVIMAIAGLVSFITLIFPLDVIPYLSPPFQVVAISLSIYLLFVAFRSWNLQKFEARVFALAGIIVFLTMCHGIFITLGIIEGRYMVMYGYHVFIVAQTILLAYRHKIIQSEKNELSRSLTGKQNDLAAVITDNRMRSQFRTELLNEIAEIARDDKGMVKSKLNSLVNDLRLQLETEDKLNYLQDNIDSINTQYEDQLKAQYPHLTDSEIEIYLLMNLNLSIKEIARVRKTSEGAIKVARHRIKRKMEIESFSNLNVELKESREKNHLKVG